MSGGWMQGKDYTPEGEWNAYQTYSGGGSYQQPYGTSYSSTLLSPKDDLHSGSDSGQATGWEAAGRGAGAGMNAGNSSGNAYTGAATGAMEGYAQGGWTGAVVGGISGYFSGKEKEKGKGKPLTFEQQMQLEVANAKYAEEVRQAKNKEMGDALAQYKPNMTPSSFQYQNNAFSNGGSPMFGVKQPTQPVVNPEQNSYGLLRGPYASG